MTFNFNPGTLARLRYDGDDKLDLKYLQNFSENNNNDHDNHNGQTIPISSTSESKKENKSKVARHKP